MRSPRPSLSHDSRNGSELREPRLEASDFSFLSDIWEVSVSGVRWNEHGATTAKDWILVFRPMGVAAFGSTISRTRDGMYHTYGVYRKVYPLV